MLAPFPSSSSQFRAEDDPRSRSTAHAARRRWATAAATNPADLAAAGRRFGLLAGGHLGGQEQNYTTVDPKLFVFFKTETRACDVQSWETKDCKAEAATAARSWETNVKDCKAETDTAAQCGGTHLKKELRSPNSEHEAGHAAQSTGS